MTTRSALLSHPGLILVQGRPPPVIASEIRSRILEAPIDSLPGLAGLSQRLLRATKSRLCHGRAMVDEEPPRTQNFPCHAAFRSRVARKGKEERWRICEDISRGRDEEVAVYRKLRPLWGKTVPVFIAFGELDFFWALFIERAEATPHGRQMLTSRERISPKRGTPRDLPTRSVRPSERSMNSVFFTKISENKMSWSNRTDLLSSSTLK
jgi:hypothetical protein